MRALLIAALACSSCSFLLTQTLPPNYNGRTQPRCDTGAGPAIVDAVLAAVGTVGDVIAISNKSETLTVTIIDAAIDALFLASAASGITETERCEKALAAWDERDDDRDDRANERAAARVEERKRKREEALAAQEDQDELTDAGIVVRDAQDVVDDAARDSGP